MRDKISLIFTFLLSLLSPVAFSSVDEEAMLRKKAELLAQKIHVKNLSLIGIDPKTCQQTDSQQVFLDQIKGIKAGSLSHCPEIVEKALAPVNQELVNVESGVLIFKPAPLPASSLPAAEPVSYPQRLEGVAETGPEIPGPANVANNTALSESDLYRIFSSYDDNPRIYRPAEDDSLFNILSKAYVRNLNRIVERPRP